MLTTQQRVMAPAFCTPLPLTSQAQAQAQAQAHRHQQCCTRRPKKRGAAAVRMLGPRLNAPTINSEAAEKTKVFEAWLTDNGMYLSKLAGWGRPKHPMAIANETTDEGEPSGRGLVAVKAINQGESLFQVPIELIITKERALELIPQLPKNLDDYMAIATLLMRERALCDASFWKPYLDVLPTNDELVPLFRWSEEDLDALRGSPSLAAARNLGRKLEREYRDMDERIFSQHRDVFDEEAFSFAHWEWAFAIIFSRAIRLTNEDLVALVPYADLLNHNPFCSSYINIESDLLAGTRHVNLYADRPYPQMSQVFVTYGPKPNADLLLLYGFVVDRNPYDSVDITVALNNEDALWVEKVAYLQRSGVKATNVFPLYRDRYPMELIEFLRFCVADRQALEEADFGDFISEENETMVANALIDACRNALETYPTSIEEDETLIKDRRMYMMLPQKQRWAIRLRLAEKKILTRTILNIEQEMSDPTFLFTTSGE